MSFQQYYKGQFEGGKTLTFAALLYPVCRGLGPPHCAHVFSTVSAHHLNTCLTKKANMFVMLTVIFLYKSSFGRGQRD